GVIFSGRVPVLRARGEGGHDSAAPRAAPGARARWGERFRAVGRVRPACGRSGRVIHNVPAATGLSKNAGRDWGVTALILVVDDEPNLADLVAMALRYEGFEA